MKRIKIVCLIIFMGVVLSAVSLLRAAAEDKTAALTFPKGTATESEVCGRCHVSIYREFAYGFGSDMKYKEMVLVSKKEQPLTIPAEVSPSATAHAYAGMDPYPVHARTTEEEGRSCNVCHFPQAYNIPDMDNPEIPKPKARAREQELGGLTCASCHLTPDGKIRGPYAVQAPHQTIEDPKMRTAAACAYCHSMGKRVVGKQTQTFLEWRDDFYKPGLGRQHCQDCHMLRTLRRTADNFDVPVRAVARHLWTGGHSEQRVASALNVTIVKPDESANDLEFHVINVNAGHSVPTGSNRRAVYLKADIVDESGRILQSREWMFAPWFADRPDDKKFLEEDKAKPDAIARMQADAQGPHETSIRAGEERILAWKPDIRVKKYTVKASLTYDLNRYNDRAFTADQTEIYHTALPVAGNAVK